MQRWSNSLSNNQTPKSMPNPRRNTNNLNRNTRSSNHNGHKPSQSYNTYYVCYKFQLTGSCPYDNRCRFKHIQQYKHNVTSTSNMNMTNDQMYSFLGEMRTLVDSCGSYCDLYRVSTTNTAAILTCSSRTNSFSRSSRNVALGEKVTKACVIPSGIHKISF